MRNANIPDFYISYRNLALVYFNHLGKAEDAIALMLKAVKLKKDDAMLFGELELSRPRYAKLMQYMRDSFTSFDTTDRGFVPVNAFIGLYLRIKFLLREKYYDILLSELNDFFGDMVAKTGTLWEYRQPQCSLDHGFASYVAHAICKALEIQ